MFGKLIKHEFRAAGRIMLPLLIALPALGLLSNLAVRLIGSDSGIVRFLCGLILFVFSLSCVAICVAAFVVMILRWCRSVHSSEGYLTNTLPVSVHGIVWSRLLTAAIYFALSMLVLALSLILMDMSRELFAELGRFVSSLMQIDLKSLQKDAVTLGVEAAVIVLAYAVAKCLHFYAAVSVGYAFNEHKGLITFLACLLMELIFVITAVKTAAFIADVPALSLDSLSSARGFLACGLAGIVLYGAVCYFITVFTVRRRLNLE